MTLLFLGDLPAYEAEEALDAMRDHIYWVTRPPKTTEESALADSAWVRFRQAYARLSIAVHGEVRQ